MTTHTAADAATTAPAHARRRTRSGGTRPVGPLGYVVLTLLGIFSLGPLVLWMKMTANRNSLYPDRPVTSEDSEKLPVATTFFSFQQGYTQNYVLISAAGLIMLVPMLLLFLALQRRFVEGVSSSGLGGA